MTTPEIHPASQRPDAGEHSEYFGRYIVQVPPGNVLDTLQQGLDTTLALLGGISPERAGFRYEPGKWSIKEVVGHMIDTERIFTYRALRFARNDKTPLPGFEQDDYMAYAHFDQRELSDLAREFEHVRMATLFLFRNLDAAAWARRGTASGGELTVRALAYMTAGHEIHHRKILAEKYF